MGKFLQAIIVYCAEMAFRLTEVDKFLSPIIRIEDKALVYIGVDITRDLPEFIRVAFEQPHTARNKKIIARVRIIVDESRGEHIVYFPDKVDSFTDTHEMLSIQGLASGDFKMVENYEGDIQPNSKLPIDGSRFFHSPLFNGKLIQVYESQINTAMGYVSKYEEEFDSEGKRVEVAIFTNLSTTWIDFCKSVKIYKNKGLRKALRRMTQSTILQQREGNRLRGGLALRDGDTIMSNKNHADGICLVSKQAAKDMFGEPVKIGSVLHGHGFVNGVYHKFNAQVVPEILDDEGILTGAKIKVLGSHYAAKAFIQANNMGDWVSFWHDKRHTKGAPISPTTLGYAIEGTLDAVRQDIEGCLLDIQSMPNGELLHRFGMHDHPAHLLGGVLDKLKLSTDDPRRKNLRLIILAGVQDRMRKAFSSLERSKQNWQLSGTSYRYLVPLIDPSQYPLLSAEARKWLKQFSDMDITDLPMHKGQHMVPQVMSEDEHFVFTLPIFANRMWYRRFDTCDFDDTISIVKVADVTDRYQYNDNVFVAVTWRYPVRFNGALYAITYNDSKETMICYPTLDIVWGKYTNEQDKNQFENDTGQICIQGDVCITKDAELWDEVKTYSKGKAARPAELREWLSVKAIPEDLDEDQLERFKRENFGDIFNKLMAGMYPTIEHYKGKRRLQKRYLKICKKVASLSPSDILDWFNGGADELPLPFDELLDLLNNLKNVIRYTPPGALPGDVGAKIRVPEYLGVRRQASVGVFTRRDEDLVFQAGGDGNDLETTRKRCIEARTYKDELTTSNDRLMPIIEEFKDSLDNEINSLIGHIKPVLEKREINPLANIIGSTVSKWWLESGKLADVLQPENAENVGIPKSEYAKMCKAYQPTRFKRVREMINGVLGFFPDAATRESLVYEMGIRAIKTRAEDRSGGLPTLSMDKWNEMWALGALRNVTQQDSQLQTSTIIMGGEVAPGDGVYKMRDNLIKSVRPGDDMTHFQKNELTTTYDYVVVSRPNTTQSVFSDEDLTVINQAMDTARSLLEEDSDE